MVDYLKKVLYFPIAGYFRFFALIRYKRWKPETIVVTGSNGKTTLFNLLKSQIGDIGKYSKHANSSYGIPFDILDLHRKSLQPREWFFLFFLAPLRAFKTPPKYKYYVVEADCDRPYEGNFLASLLRPEVVLWLNTARTHGMNFDSLVSQKKFSTVEEAIAYEYGYFPEYCQNLAVINGDSDLQKEQLRRTKATVYQVTKDKSLQDYAVTEKGTAFRIDGESYTFPALLPEELFYSIAFCRKTMEYLGLTFDKSFKEFVLPPGRNNLFAGIKGITILDSSYNANLSSMTAVINMFDSYPAKVKWAVLGDMLEQGKGEQAEHEKLAGLIASKSFKRIILMGPRVSDYTYPALNGLISKDVKIEKFLNPNEVLSYLRENIQGSEAIVFKGARFLEGVVENLLSDKEDAKYLCRREKVWELRRKRFGL